MRILIFTDAWEPQTNGVVRTLTTTVDNLRSRGHVVEVVSPNDFLRIPHCLTNWAYPDVTFSIPPILKISRIISKFKPDAIHISTEGPIGWSAWTTCLFRGMKFTTTYHTKFPEYIKERFYVPLCLGYAYEKLFHNRSSRTMVATESLRKEMDDRGFKRMAIWGRGVDTELFNPKHQSVDCYSVEHQPVALFFGRVSHEKNIEVFLDAKWRGKKYVIGDGPQLAGLREKYKDVVFLGKKKGIDLATHVASACITVFPSLTDTFGLTVTESLACGTPVSAFAVTGPIDQIEQFKTGTVGPTQLEGYTQAQILERGMHWASYLKREDCRAYAETKTWDACTDQFLKNLEDDKCNIELYSSPTSILGVVMLKVRLFFRLLKTRTSRKSTSSETSLTSGR